MGGCGPSLGQQVFKVLIAGLAALYLLPATAAELTLIHMGDLHGHLMPRPSMRATDTPKTEGGLARRVFQDCRNSYTAGQAKDASAQYR
jgi:hypothetical protein